MSEKILSIEKILAREPVSEIMFELYDDDAKLFSDAIQIIDKHSADVTMKIHENPDPQIVFLTLSRDRAFIFELDILKNTITNLKYTKSPTYVFATSFMFDSANISIPFNKHYTNNINHIKFKLVEYKTKGIARFNDKQYEVNFEEYDYYIVVNGKKHTNIGLIDEEPIDIPPISDLIVSRDLICECPISKLTENELIYTGEEYIDKQVKNIFKNLTLDYITEFIMAESHNLVKIYTDNIIFNILY